MSRVRTTSASQALAEMLGPDPTDSIASHLYDCQRAFVGFQQAANDARRVRDRAIRSAARAGYSQAKIAKATGLTPGRITQIIGLHSGRKGGK